MTRTTHDRLLDHHSYDLDSNIVLDGATDTYSGGSLLHDVIEDMDDRIVTLSGSGGGGGSDDLQLLPDNDANFTTTIGSWLAGATGVVSRDTSVHSYNNPASLKLTVNNPDDYAYLPVSGTFKSGVPYVAVIVATCDSPGAAMEFQFGLIGTDAADDNTYLQLSDPTWSQNAVYLLWTPTANRTGVTIRWTNHGSGNVNITMARLYQSAEPRYVKDGGFASGWRDLYLFPANYIGGMHLGPASHNGVTMDPLNGYVALEGQAYGGAAWQLNDEGAGSNSQLNGWVEHIPADISELGFNLEVGSDYIGFYISEKDSNTIQFYPDYSGGYDIELKDRGSGKHWKMVTAAGVAAIPSMGMLPQYSAAPHSGSEIEGESYYDTTLHKSRTWDGSAWQNHW